MWRHQVEAVQVTGRRALAIDLPGHGTRTGERFTVDGCLGAVDGAVAALGGGPVTVVGLSLGGYIALHWAARRPGRVRAVVAAGCTAIPGGPLTRGWAAAARAIGRLPDHGAGLNEALVRRMIPPAGAADLAAGGYALDAMVDMLDEMARVDPLADVGALTCPVWLVNGRWDHFRLGERSFHRAAPWARTVLIPGATHLVSLVAPVGFTRVLLDALDTVDAAPDAAATSSTRAPRPAETTRVGNETRPTDDADPAVA